MGYTSIGMGALQCTICVSDGFGAPTSRLKPVSALLFLFLSGNVLYLQFFLEHYISQSTV